jgi:hypothetical protein
MAAEEVLRSPKLNKIVIMTMQKLNTAQPVIMVGRRPILSRKKAGTKLPMGNINTTKPAISRDVEGLNLTFCSRTVGM